MELPTCISELPSTSTVEHLHGPVARNRGRLPPGQAISPALSPRPRLLPQEAIEKQLGPAVATQRLIFTGRVLDNAKTLSE